MIGRAQLHAPHRRRHHALEALEAVEERVVLLGEVVEGHPDRQRDHDRVDALGAHREPADERPAHRRDHEREHHRQPPGPAQADVGAARGEDRVHVARDARDRHLGERDHAAVAGEERQRERDEPQGERLRADLVGEERRGHPRVDQHRQQHQHVPRPHPPPHPPRPADGIAATSPSPLRGEGRGEGRAASRTAARRPAAPRPRVPPRPRVHRLPPVGRAHVRLPRMPCGRKASTSAMMTKVNTTL